MLAFKNPSERNRRSDEMTMIFSGGIHFLHHFLHDEKIAGPCNFLIASSRKKLFQAANLSELFGPISMGPCHPVWWFVRHFSSGF